jgi:uncharacterized membrane protein YgcG
MKKRQPPSMEGGGGGGGFTQETASTTVSQNLLLLILAELINHPFSTQRTGKQRDEEIARISTLTFPAFLEVVTELKGNAQSRGLSKEVQKLIQKNKSMRDIFSQILPLADIIKAFDIQQEKKTGYINLIEDIGQALKPDSKGGGAPPIAERLPRQPFFTGRPGLSALPFPKRPLGDRGGGGGAAPKSAHTSVPYSGEFMRLILATFYVRIQQKRTDQQKVKVLQDILKSTFPDFAAIENLMDNCEAYDQMHPETPQDSKITPQVKKLIQSNESMENIFSYLAAHVDDILKGTTEQEYKKNFTEVKRLLLELPSFKTIYEEYKKREGLVCLAGALLGHISKKKTEEQRKTEMTEILLLTFPEFLQRIKDHVNIQAPFFRQKQGMVKKLKERNTPMREILTELKHFSQDRRVSPESNYRVLFQRVKPFLSLVSLDSSVPIIDDGPQSLNVQQLLSEIRRRVLDNKTIITEEFIRKLVVLSKKLESQEVSITPALLFMLLQYMWLNIKLYTSKHHKPQWQGVEINISAYLSRYFSTLTTHKNPLCNIFKMLQMFTFGDKLDVEPLSDISNTLVILQYWLIHDNGHILETTEKKKEMVRFFEILDHFQQLTKEERRTKFLNRFVELLQDDTTQVQAPPTPYTTYLENMYHTMVALYETSTHFLSFLLSADVHDLATTSSKGTRQSGGGGGGGGGRSGGGGGGGGWVSDSGVDRDDSINGIINDVTFIMFSVYLQEVQESDGTGQPVLLCKEFLEAWGKKKFYDVQQLGRPYIMYLLVLFRVFLEKIIKKFPNARVVINELWGKILSVVGISKTEVEKDVSLFKNKKGSTFHIIKKVEELDKQQALRQRKQKELEQLSVIRNGRIQRLKNEYLGKIPIFDYESPPVLFKYIHGKHRQEQKEEDLYIVLPPITLRGQSTKYDVDPYTKRPGIIVAQYDEKQKKIVTSEEIPPSVLQYYESCIVLFHTVMESYLSNFTKEGLQKLTQQDVQQFEDLLITVTENLELLQNARKQSFEFDFDRTLTNEDNLVLYLLSLSSGISTVTRASQTTQQTSRRVSLFKKYMEQPIMELLIQILLSIPNTARGNPQLFVIDTMNILRGKSDTKLRDIKYGDIVRSDSSLQQFRTTLESQFRRYRKQNVQGKLKENSFYIFTYPVFQESDYKGPLLTLSPPLTRFIIPPQQRRQFQGATSSSSSSSSSSLPVKDGPRKLYILNINMKRNTSTLKFERVWDDAIVLNTGNFLLYLKNLAIKTGDINEASIEQSIDKLGMRGMLDTVTPKRRDEIIKQLLNVIQRLKTVEIFIISKDKWRDWVPGKQQGHPSAGGGGGGGGGGRRSSISASTPSVGGRGRGGGGGGGGRGSSFSTTSIVGGRGGSGSGGGGRRSSIPPSSTSIGGGGGGGGGGGQGSSSPSVYGGSTSGGFRKSSR